MEFFGITMKGEIIIEIVPTLPPFTTADTGRIIYVSGTDNFYYGGVSAWLIPGATQAATLAEIIAGIENKKFISPLGLIQMKATNAEISTGTDNIKYATASGIRSLKATSAEAWTGVNDIKYVTPAGLRYLKASIAESAAGVDDIKYVTPAGLKSRMDSNPGVLPGTFIFFAGPSAPVGYLKCNGAEISRITYAGLFNAIGGYYGVGNGTTTFNIPDLRGEFIRGWDEGRGADPGRGFATWQADEFKTHRHQLNIFRNNTNSGGFAEDANNSGTAYQNYTEYEGGSETRPRNIAMLPCIKY